MPGRLDYDKRALQRRTRTERAVYIKNQHEPKPGSCGKTQQQCLAGLRRILSDLELQLPIGEWKFISSLLYQGLRRRWSDKQLACAQEKLKRYPPKQK